MVIPLSMESDEQLSWEDQEAELREAAPGVVIFFGLIGDGAGALMLRTAAMEGASMGFLGTAVALVVGSTWAIKKSTVG